MKRTITLALCFVILAAAFSGCGGAKTPSFGVTNGSGWTFMEIYVSPMEADGWGDDLLGGSGVLKKGGAVTLTPGAASSSGLYDISCVDEDGDTWDFERVPVKDGASITIYLGGDGEPALEVSDGKGASSTVPGKLSGESESGGSRPAPATARPSATPKPTPEPTPTPNPSKDDPLDLSYAMTGYPGGMPIPYPSTMKVCGENVNNRYVQFDAVYEPDYFENIAVNLIQITNYDYYFTSGNAYAREGLNKLFDQIIQMTYSDYYIKSIGSDFINGGSYYGLVQYVWLSGTYFTDGGDTPVRAVVEMRYCGPTGYLLFVVTAADEGVIQRYYDIARNIANAIPLGGNWSTAVQGGGSSGNYSGGGYDPWNWDDYDPWSDPGDYYEDGGGNYYYDDGQRFESNDADW